jgi:hypothetical protein
MDGYDSQDARAAVEIARDVRLRPREKKKGASAARETHKNVMAKPPTVREL